MNERNTWNMPRGDMSSPAARSFSAHDTTPSPNADLCGNSTVNTLRSTGHKGLSRTKNMSLGKGLFMALHEMFEEEIRRIICCFCWNVTLCGTMSCLQDQTLCCEAILRAEHCDCLGSSIGVVRISLWAR